MLSVAVAPMTVAPVTVDPVTVDSVTVASVPAIVIVVMAALMQVVMTRGVVKMVPVAVNLTGVPIVVAGVVPVVVTTIGLSSVETARLIAVTAVLRVSDTNLNTGTTELNTKWTGRFDAIRPHSS